MNGLNISLEKNNFNGVKSPIYRDAVRTKQLSKFESETVKCVQNEILSLCFAHLLWCFLDWPKSSGSNGE